MADEEEEEGGGGPSPGEIVAFVREAPRRHRRAAVTGFAVALFGGVVIAAVKPPLYTSEVRILAQRNDMVKQIATRSTRDESLTKGAGEIILKRENLLGMIDEVKLYDRWEVERTPFQHVLDAVLEKVRGKPKPEDKLRAIVGVLEKRIIVTSDDLTIAITAQWSNAKTAFELAQAAEERFVNARRASEVGMIGDAIDILEAHLKTERENVDHMVADLQRLENRHTPGATPAADATEDAGAPEKTDKTDRRVVVRVARAAAPNRSFEQKEIQDKRARLAEVRAERQRQVDDLNAQVASLRATLTPAHPSIVALETRLQAASRPSAAEISLEQDLRQLELEAADEPSAPHYESTAQSGDGHDAGAPTGAIVVVGRPEDDAETTLARQRLTAATNKVEELQIQISKARIELDVAETAFKYRYSVITPPEVAREAKKPTSAMIAAIGAVLAVLLYFIVPLLLDLASGRFIAAWQAKGLGIPLLAELDPPG